MGEEIKVASKILQEENYTQRGIGRETSMLVFA